MIFTAFKMERNHIFLGDSPNSRRYILWAYGVVVSMFDFHLSDRGSNPGRGANISQCLRLHYRAEPLASVWKTISHGFTQSILGKLGSQMGT